MKLYNTLTRRKDEFVPLVPGKVGIYTCGPTVYMFSHIGNFRAYVFSDTLRRVMEYLGYEVKHVMNVTDVGHLTSDADTGEDKLEKSAASEGRTPEEIAQFYTHFLGDPVTREQIADIAWQCMQDEWEFNRRAGFGASDDEMPDCMKQDAIGPAKFVWDVPADVVAAAYERFAAGSKLGKIVLELAP